MLAQPQILKAVVNNINERKAKRIKPLQQELDSITARIAQLEEKRQRYFELYEIDQLDKELFSKRLDDINAELNRQHVKKSELVLELQDDNSEPVSYEVVRALLEKFDKLLASSPFEQRKMLMHLVIKQITIKNTRTVDKIEMNFDENTVHHFLAADPSATHAEGSFALWMRRALAGQKVWFAI